MSNTDNPVEPTGGDNGTSPATQSLPAKLRVHALAKRLATSSRAVLAAITELGGSARTVQSSVDRELASRVADHLGTPITGDAQPPTADAPGAAGGGSNGADQGSTGTAPDRSKAGASAGSGAHAPVESPAAAETDTSTRETAQAGSAESGESTDLFTALRRTSPAEETGGSEQERSGVDFFGASGQASPTEQSARPGSPGTRSSGPPPSTAASPLFLQPEPQPASSPASNAPASNDPASDDPASDEREEAASNDPGRQGGSDDERADDRTDGAEYDDDDDSDTDEGGRRRRRRGRRGRGRGKGGPEGEADEDGETAQADDSGSGEQPEKRADQGKSDQKQAEQKPSGQKQSGQKQSAQKQADQKQADQKPSDQKPSDQKQAEQKPSGQKQSGQKQADQKQADQKQADQKQADQDDNTGRNGQQAGGEQSGQSGNAEDDGDTDSNASKRRRRRRRRKGGDDNAGPAGDPPNTVTHVRENQGTSGDEVRAVRGSTRLEAKRQRRRDGREAGKRRTPALSEAEFLARRESVQRRMVVREQAQHTQIGVLEDGVLVEHFVTAHGSGSLVGNVYLGRVQNVLPSMEAAFVDIGRGRNAVLYAGEVDWDATGLAGKSRRIEQALNTGDSVLVQVTKDPVGHKGARLTTQVSLPGRYLVYVPGGSATGISRKLPDNERKRLKDILKRVVPDEAGVIIRTASEGISEEDLGRDVHRLQAQWDAINERSSSGSIKAPELIYEEPDLLVKVVRDLFTEDFIELVVSGEQAWQTINSYVEQLAPDMISRVRKHTGGDVFGEYRIDEQIAKALDRKVWLPSGGHLVIDRTEAMTVIDVNTGKFTGSGGNLEETVTRNNLESAEEIVRQLRLRDIGGIIVIDFIDMVLESNRDLVLRRLTECLGRDRTRHQVAEVTSLGLVQMTRKRVGTGLLEAFSTSCEQCKGRGVVVSATPVEEPPNNGSSSGNGNGNGRKSRTKNKNRNNEQQQDPQEAERAAQRIAATALLHAKATEAAEKEVESGGATTEQDTVEGDTTGAASQQAQASGTQAGEENGAAGSRGRGKGEERKGGKAADRESGASGPAVTGAVRAHQASAVSGADPSAASEPAVTEATAERAEQRPSGASGQVKPSGSGRSSEGTKPSEEAKPSEGTKLSQEAKPSDEVQRNQHAAAKRAAGPPAAKTGQPAATTGPDSNGAAAPTASGSASVLAASEPARRTRRAASRPSGAPVQEESSG